MLRYMGQQDIRAPTRGLGVMRFGVQGVVGPMCFVWMVYSLHSDLLYVVQMSRVTLPYLARAQ